MNIEALGEDFARFLLEAKRRTYAARGDDASVPPLLPRSSQLEYAEGPLVYRDIYFGMDYFVGQETVYRSAEPVWSLSYAGGLGEGVTPTERSRIYAFLREALRQVSPEHPFRGPPALRSGPYTYAHTSLGDLAACSGHEAIARDGLTVYELRYAGGALR